MANILIIETSTERALVALAQDDKLLFHEELPFGMRSSNYLLPAIQKAFTATGLSVAHLHSIAVGVGPGLFTGMRVAASMAKGLSLARCLPLIPLCSLSGFISPQEGVFASVIDAHMGGAYLLLQERRGEQIVELSPAQLLPQKELIEQLEGCSSIVGPSFQKLILPDATECAPDAAHLAKIAYNRFIAKEHSSPETLTLEYFRTE